MGRNSPTVDAASLDLLGDDRFPDVIGQLGEFRCANPIFLKQSVGIRSLSHLETVARGGISSSRDSIPL